jgi:hypothetical protein
VTEQPPEYIEPEAGQDPDGTAASHPATDDDDDPDTPGPLPDDDPGPAVDVRRILAGQEECLHDRSVPST